MPPLLHLHISIRPALISDIFHLGAIESASDCLFIEAGMAAIAQLKPQPNSIYAIHQERGHLWVATLFHLFHQVLLTQALPQFPIAFIQIDIFNNTETFQTVYIHQISVSPDYARRGIGARLVETVEEWARRKGYKALDLTTFEGVPWNRAYYERLGFRVLTERKLDEEDARYLRSQLQVEREDEVLGRWERVAMRKVL